MIKQFLKKLIDTLKNLDEKILKILKYGLKFCFAVLILSAMLLITYLFFIHSDFIFQIGLLTFQIGVCFVAEFFASAKNGKSCGIAAANHREIGVFLCISTQIRVKLVRFWRTCIFNLRLWPKSCRIITCFENPVG